MIKKNYSTEDFKKYFIRNPELLRSQLLNLNEYIEDEHQIKDSIKRLLLSFYEIGIEIIKKWTNLKPKTHIQKQNSLSTQNDIRTYHTFNTDLLGQNESQNNEYV